MYIINLGVTKQKTKGASDFFEAFKQLMQNADTWTVVETSLSEATIRSKATLSALPSQPEWKLSVTAFSGSVTAHLENKDLDEDQKAKAAGYFVYLCLTHLSSYVNKVEITSITV